MDITITARPASGPGALAGFQVACSCGLVWTTSMETSATTEAAEHDAWHQRARRVTLSVDPREFNRKGYLR